MPMSNTDKPTPKQSSPSSTPAPQKKMRKFEFQLNVNQFLSRGLFVFFLALLIVPFLFSKLPGQKDVVPLSQVLNDVRDHKVQKLEIDGADIQVTYQDGTVKTSRKEGNAEIVDTLHNANIDPGSVNIEVKNVSW